MLLLEVLSSLLVLRKLVNWLRRGPLTRAGMRSCHTPFQERGNEASIRVPRMFKSHAWQQYDKQMQCYKIMSNISYITTRGSEKDYIKAAEITKRSAAPQA
jgi:hypothetical protein